MSGKLIASSAVRSWPHRIACATAVATFLLIFVGGGVTSRDSGMAFVDWPTSDGRFLNPPGWLGDSHKLWEHTHRLLGYAVGILSIGLCIPAFHGSNNRVFRFLAPLALTAITAQGVMGGLRVVEWSETWAAIHGVWGQVCFSIVVCNVALTSTWWAEPKDGGPRSNSPILRPLSVAVFVLLLAQVGTGAYTRHFNDGFMLHFVGAMIATGLITWLILGLESLFSQGRTPLDPGGSAIANQPSSYRTTASGWNWARKLSITLAVLLGLQLVLGMTAYLVTGGSSIAVTSPTLTQWLVPTAHVVIGALLLATSAVATLAVYRFVEGSPECRPLIPQSSAPSR